jgi:hypothetical protein
MSPIGCELKACQARLLGEQLASGFSSLTFSHLKNVHPDIVETFSIQAHAHSVVRK